MVTVVYCLVACSSQLGVVSSRKPPAKQVLADGGDAVQTIWCNYRRLGPLLMHAFVGLDPRWSYAAVGLGPHWAPCQSMQLWGREPHGSVGVAMLCSVHVVAGGRLYPPACPAVLSLGGTRGTPFLEFHTSCCFI